ncbi:D-phenylhydantoinase [Streptomyces alboniger]
MSNRTLIRGGLVITAAEETHADVLIEDGRIAALAASGSAAAGAWSAERIIDATGKYVIPGGVDAHTHMEFPFGGTASSDTFETGTRAAAWGGTTTIVDFAVQSVGHSLRGGLDAYYAKADGKCAIDYAFHMIVSDVNKSSLKEMDALVGEGVTSSELFTAYPGVFYSDDGQILRAMQKAATNGALIMMHAENGIAIDVLVQQALARGETDPRYHGEVRRALLEAEATHRVIQLARVAEAPLYVVHVSAEEAVAELAAARGKRPARSSARPARSTSSSPRTTSRNRTSRARSTCAPRLCGPSSTRRRSGAACAPTTSRWSPPTTARSASRARRSWAAATSPGSPTGCPAWRTAWTCSTRRSWTDTSRAAAGSRSRARPRRGCSASTARRAPSRPAPTRTSSSTTRPPSRPCRRPRTT